jgi:hypothetical protein
MRTSSESIAQIAAAMAKAQSELVNPAKSLTAVLDRGRNGNGPLRYRYAPLSAGLDILRKVLGKYELAVIQTTNMDRDRGLVLLTHHGSTQFRRMDQCPLACLSRFGYGSSEAHGRSPHIRAPLLSLHDRRACGRR